MGDWSGEATALDNMGIAYSKLGDLEQAQESFQKSLDIQSHLGAKRRAAAVHMHLGDLLYSRGQYNPAFSHYQEGLRIWRVLEDDGNIALALNNLGECAMS